MGHRVINRKWAGWRITRHCGELHVIMIYYTRHIKITRHDNNLHVIIPIPPLIRHIPPAVHSNWLGGNVPTSPPICHSPARPHHPARSPTHRRHPPSGRNITISARSDRRSSEYRTIAPVCPGDADQRLPSGYTTTSFRTSSCARYTFRSFREQVIIPGHMFTTCWDVYWKASMEAS
jgi:hypothetical protein